MNQSVFVGRKYAGGAKRKSSMADDDGMMSSDQEGGESYERNGGIASSFEFGGHRR